MKRSSPHIPYTHTRGRIPHGTQPRRNVAILTLALGIGATTAVFTVIDAAILRPLPFPDPERLVIVQVEVERLPRGPSRYAPSAHDIRVLQAASDVFTAVAAWRNVMFGRIVDSPFGAGIAGALAATRVIESFLFQSEPTIPPRSWPSRLRSRRQGAWPPGSQRAARRASIRSRL